MEISFVAYLFIHFLLRGCPLFWASLLRKTTWNVYLISISVILSAFAAVVCLIVLFVLSMLTMTMISEFVKLEDVV